MHICKYCDSSHTKRSGTYINKSGLTHQRVRCNDCNRSFSFIRDIDNVRAEVVPTAYRLVITSCQNNTKINQTFFDALCAYTDHNNAKLLVIPTVYRATLEKTDSLWWDVPSDYLCDTNVDLEHIRIYGALKILPTAENPLAGLDPLSKGKTVIVGHNQLQMRSLPVSINSTPAILHTTGTISVPNYTISKQGEKATFNHSYSAIVVEIDSNDGLFHIRVLNADHTGAFFDLDTHYHPDGTITPNCEVSALVTGDEHAMFIDPMVRNAVYDSDDSIVNTLKPKVIVRHDLVDSHSISHHDRDNFFQRYIKHIYGRDCLETELLITEQLLSDTTPDYAVNWIVSSNHHDHITKWLNITDPKQDVKNAKLYHWMMWNMLSQLGSDKQMTPFELWLRRNDSDISKRTKFLNRLESAYINGIDVSLHGDVASGGAKGSAVAFSKLPQKTITGHSHSPFIQQGAYGVGCLCIKNLSYVNGPGSWMATSCVIHTNGKRQLITVINGKWRI